jgi:hypothetical protein
VPQLKEGLLDAHLRPAQLRRVHPVYLEGLVTELAADMRLNGWRGRPLLVEEEDQTLSITQYFAWTGTHRIAAAEEAGLKTVPCKVITTAVARAAFLGAGYPSYREHHWSCWRDAISSWEGKYDRDRLRGLRRAGLDEAAAMIEEEISAPDGRT